ncbi:hypothetical protein [Micromonospora rhizosphaerae]|uniref:hypothetical protein n=1 Tax=Micromonospora rhizosphaerae TaxID=568872 RepID=UPI000AFC45B7|nr:hypothetical protein [Micromonospora rhizosphaerae]
MTRYTLPVLADPPKATPGTVHDTSHVRDLPPLPDDPEVELDRALAAQLVREKAIIGVFDEGCMGMYNAIFDDAGGWTTPA